jgi:hypothetical protein
MERKRKISADWMIVQRRYSYLAQECIAFDFTLRVTFDRCLQSPTDQCSFHVPCSHSTVTEGEGKVFIQLNTGPRVRLGS